MHFIGVLNRDGGTLRTTDLESFVAAARTVFAEHGHTIDCRLVSGSDIAAELKRAVAEPGIDALLAGGGDGTISTAAAACFRSGVPLAVLPAGTMNLFARSLRVPLNLNDAVRALAAGSIGEVDIATANDHPFVHQYSVGMHARLVRLREQLAYKSRWGKILATLRAVLSAISRPLTFEAEIRTPRGLERRVAAGISVSNNVLGEGHIPHADILDAGVLGVYVIKPMPPAEMAKFLIGLVLGNWKGHPLVSEKEVQQVSLHFPKRKSKVHAVLDGELIPLERDVDLKVHPKALKVVLPVDPVG